MRLLVPRGPLMRMLRRVQYVLLAGGIAMLTYCGFVLMDARMFQNRERQHLERLLRDRQAANSGAHKTASAAGNPPPVIDGLIGRIEIQRLGLSAMVMEGTDRITLGRAVGHIAGTALPGHAGNVGIAGHRDTFFRPLRNIQPHDTITLTTLGGEYRYRVVSIKVVGPYDVAVLDPSATEILTLVTCYPFYVVGSAPERLIVRAERVGDI